MVVVKNLLVFLLFCNIFNSCIKNDAAELQDKKIEFLEKKINELEKKIEKIEQSQDNTTKNLEIKFQSINDQLKNKNS